MKNSIKEQHCINGDLKILLVDFINQNGGLVFHEPMFNLIAAKHHRTKFLYKIIVDSNNEIIACCPFHISKRFIIQKIETKILFDVPYGGWIISEKLDSFNLSKALGRNSINRIEYYSGLINCESTQNDFWNKGFYRLETPVIMLDPLIQEIWEHSLDSSRRNKIRKAQQSEVVVESSDSLSNFDYFWPLLDQMHKKYGLYNNYLYYKEIFEIYSPLGQAKIFLAKRNNELLSGIFLVGNKRVMHYWKGASIPNVKNYGQGELLQWEAIIWAKSKGIFLYDLCIVERERLPSIYEFKTGFSKLMYNCYSKSYTGLAYKLINRLLNAY
jgi:hypothetical protein